MYQRKGEDNQDGNGKSECDPNWSFHQLAPLDQRFNFAICQLLGAGASRKLHVHGNFECDSEFFHKKQFEAQERMCPTRSLSVTRRLNMSKLLYSPLPVLIVLAMACSVQAHAAAQGAFDRTLNVSGTVYLEVSTGSGSINIRHGQTHRVEIHGRIRSGDSWWWPGRDSEDIVRRLEANPPIEQSGQTIRIGRVSDREGFQHVSISYEIVVPAQSNIKAHSGSGRQSIDGIDGRVE